MAGAAILALLMNSPQVKAEDDIVVFGGEFEDAATKSKKVEEPAPPKELPPAETKQIVPDDPPAVEPIEKQEPPPPPLQQDKPAQIAQEKPQSQPLEQDEPAQIVQEKPQTQPLEQNEPEDENWGDTLTFDDLKNTPEQKPLEQTQPKVEPKEFEHPFEQPAEISSEQREPVEFIPPPVPVTTIEEPPHVTTVEEPPQVIRRSAPPRQTQPQKNLKTLKPRFVKLAVDDTYVYYLDKSAVEWKKMPYSTTEYMADVWIRMVERKPKALDDDMANYGADNFKAQIDLAREQGYQYSPEDIQVLRQQSYVLEHYYLRPKTRQVQFLCELEVFGRPQNTINERAYNASNWENLVPGSVESTIYEAAIKVLGKSKSTERGHMTFIDMLEEYGRFSLR